MTTAVQWVNSILPKKNPGICWELREPEDLFVVVENGVDLFDCVAPTRIARNGGLYTSVGKIHLMNAKVYERFF